MNKKIIETTEIVGLFWPFALVISFTAGCFNFGWKPFYVSITSYLTILILNIIILKLKK